MLEWTLIRGIMVAFFILANSFFVAAEFALVSIRETRVQQLIALGRPGARTVLQLKRNMDDFLPAVQFGVTLAALALGWIGEPALASIFTSAASLLLRHLPPLWTVYSNVTAVVLSFALITYLEVLLGELVPKSLALQRAERIALAVAGPMDVFIRITSPAIKLMNGSATMVLKLFKAPLRGDGGAVHSPEELKLIATATRRMGLLPVYQEEIIHRAIELSHLVVREILTPRARIFALPASLPLEQASARIVDEGHTRVPVFDPVRGPEHIIGIVHSKDIARLMHFRAAALAFHVAALSSRPTGVPSEAVTSHDMPLPRGAGPSGSTRPGDSGLTLRDVMREVLFVPETKLVVELLQEFQERRRQIAIVVDEFGSTVGLVTAEDALEQIVGELRDEFDELEESGHATGRKIIASPAETAAGAMLLDGATSLRDLSTRLDWEFPRQPGVETLAGFVLAELGHLPAVGESVIHARRRFTVVEMHGRRIGTIRIDPLAASPNTADATATEDDGLEVSA